MKKRLHTDLPLPSKVGAREYFRAWRNKMGRKPMTCECGRGVKTDKNKGCAQCNAETANFESSQLTRSERWLRHSPNSKYASWAMTFMGNGSYHHKVPATSL